VITNRGYAASSVASSPGNFRVSGQMEGKDSAGPRLSIRDIVLIDRLDIGLRIRAVGAHG